MNNQNDMQVVVVAIEWHEMDLRGLARLLITQTRDQQTQAANGAVEDRDAA